MASKNSTDIPDFDSIHVPAEDLADITTESMAQNVASYRNLMLRYEKTLADPNVDLRRIMFVLGESIDAFRQIEKGFQREQLAGRPPSLPFAEYIQLKTFSDTVPRRAMHKVAKRYPFATGPFVDELIAWAKALPDSSDKDLYIRTALGAGQLYEHMLVSTSGIPMFMPLFISQAQQATDAMGRLQSSHGGSPPGLPPGNGGGSGGGPPGGEDIERRVSGLEVAMNSVARDMAEMKISIATMAESMKHVATREDLARLPQPELSTAGLATKEDLTPIVSDVAGIKERLKHVPTKFGLAVAVATPVVGAAWWIIQQVITAWFN